jgi:O-antigen ligase
MIKKLSISMQTIRNRLVEMNIAKNIVKFVITLYLGYFTALTIISPTANQIKIAIFILLSSILLLLLNPLWSFLVLLFLRPYADLLRDYYLVGGVNFVGVFSFMNIIFAGYVLLRVQNVKLFPANLKWFYLYLFIAFISILNYPTRPALFTSLVGLAKLMSLLALFLLGYNLPNSFKDVQKIIRTILLSSVIPILYGLYQVIAKEGVGQGAYTTRSKNIARITSFFVLANPFSFWLGIIILVAILSVIFSKKKENVFNLLVLTGASICLLFTYTRSAWISMLLVLLFISIYIKNVRTWVIICSLIIVVFAYDIILLRLEDLIIPPKYGYNSFEFRVKIAKALLTNAVPLHVFFGHGINLSEWVSDKYTEFKGFPPHNDYLRVLVETGIFGLIAYVVFLGKMFFNLFGLIHNKINPHINSILLGILIFYMSNSMSDNIFTFISGAGYIFCIMGLALKLNELEDSKEKEFVKI